MNKIIERLVILAFVIVFVLLIGGCIKWRWDECTNVGHSALYCVIDMWSK